MPFQDISSQHRGRSKVLAELREVPWQEQSERDHRRDGRADEQGRQYSSATAKVEFRNDTRTGRSNGGRQELRDEIAGDDEEYIDPDVPAAEARQASMKEHTTSTAIPQWSINVGAVVRPSPKAPAAPRAVTADLAVGSGVNTSA